MKGLAKAGVGGLVLGLTVVVLALLFGSLAGAGRQPTALAPTPTPTSRPPLLSNLLITPTVFLTPKPTPTLIIDPTWNPPTPTPYPPRPTPTPGRLPAAPISANRRL